MRLQVPHAPNGDTCQIRASHYIADERASVVPPCSGFGRAWLTAKLLFLVGGDTGKFSRGSPNGEVNGGQPPEPPFQLTIWREGAAMLFQPAILPTNVPPPPNLHSPRCGDRPPTPDNPTTARFFNCFLTRGGMTSAVN